MELENLTVKVTAEGLQEVCTQLRELDRLLSKIIGKKKNLESLGVDIEFSSVLAAYVNDMLDDGRMRGIARDEIARARRADIDAFKMAASMTPAERAARRDALLAAPEISG